MKLVVQTLKSTLRLSRIRKRIYMKNKYFSLRQNLESDISDTLYAMKDVPQKATPLERKEVFPLRLLFD